VVYRMNFLFFFFFFLSFCLKQTEVPLPPSSLCTKYRGDFQGHTESDSWIPISAPSIIRSWSGTSMVLFPVLSGSPCLEHFRSVDGFLPDVQAVHGLRSKQFIILYSTCT
jgi:hypothetical protein